MKQPVENPVAHDGLLKMAFRWRRELLWLGLMTVVLSAIVSSPWVITPKFRSYAVLYPANIIPMGTETPTEQMMQVLESDAIRDSVVQRYGLYEVYGINPERKSARSTMIREYESNVRTRKTEYESVVVDVMDPDPIRARDMVNSIIHYFNRKQKEMQREKSLEVVKILSEQTAAKKAEMDSMEAVLTGIRKKYGILDYALQTEYATERYLQVITSANKKSAEEIEPLLTALKDMGGEFVALNEHLWRVRGNYNNLKEQLEQARQDVEKQLTFCNVITHPEVADRKSYPVRWLIVLTALLSTMLLALVVISLIESLNTHPKA